ncbi:MAG: NupC/NupG family nucleoside CNT transporter [Quinella sp. 3Q1]|nr:NupC/NupG family nucleoside CNT transporter [Quinella sp. 3Q1]MBR6888393.1 NupC/NupG family nucleoside CNT transporter [Selenomonadaceae bacterium]
MAVVINLAALIVFLALAILFSHDRRAINKKTVAKLLALNIFVGWFLISFEIGREMIVVAAKAFTAVVSISYEGVAFALPNWVNVPQMNFVTAALLPLLLIVPMFDILNYVGIMPFMIKWIGRGLSFVTGAPKFESFFAAEMAVLGIPDVQAVSATQLQKISTQRCLTIAIMSMNCVSASIIGSYIQMMPAEFILTAIPLNVINALMIAHILYPVNVSPEEDDEVFSTSGSEKKLPFFNFLGNSILGAGKLVFIVTCMVIAFVSLAKLINAGLALINPAISLEAALGLIMFPFAWLLVPETAEAFQLAQFMGTKLITNEFVVMLQAQPLMENFSRHMQCVLTVFVTSFANLGTVGILLGTFSGIVDKNKNELISQNVKFMIASGILVSLMSAGIAGLFVR